MQFRDEHQELLQRAREWRGIAKLERHEDATLSSDHDNMFWRRCYGRVAVSVVA